jgi:hypothetical protein
MLPKRTFDVTCRHCAAVVLRVDRIRESDEQALATHVTTVHPEVDFYTPKLVHLLEHFTVKYQSSRG